MAPPEERHAPPPADAAAPAWRGARGAAGSWSLTNLAPRMLRGDFAPGFMVEHFVKDMRLALDECRRLDLPLPGLALVESLYTALVAQGQGRSGTQALVLALAQLAHHPWAPAPTAQVS